MRRPAPPVAAPVAVVRTVAATTPGPIRLGPARTVRLADPQQLARMTPAQRRRKARQRQAVELRAKGWSLRAIAAHLGVSHEAVRKDLESVNF